MSKLFLVASIAIVGLIACTGSTVPAAPSEATAVIASDEPVTQSVEVSEASPGSVSDVGDMKAARHQFAGVALADGRALVMGGKGVGVGQGGYGIGTLNGTAEV